MLLIRTTSSSNSLESKNMYTTSLLKELVWGFRMFRVRVWFGFGFLDSVCVFFVNNFGIDLSPLFLTPATMIGPDMCPAHSGCPGGSHRLHALCLSLFLSSLLLPCIPVEYVHPHLYGSTSPVYTSPLFCSHSLHFPNNP